MSNQEICWVLAMFQYSVLFSITGVIYNSILWFSRYENKLLRKHYEVLYDFDGNVRRSLASSFDVVSVFAERDTLSHSLTFANFLPAKFSSR